MENILIDRTQWSQSSQRSSGHYDSRANQYENISYQCVKCELIAIFTAEEQKYSYEVKKQFIRRIPNLCATCQTKLESLLATEKEFQQSWSVNSHALKSNVVFLKDWLTLLREIHTFGKATNYTMVKGILKLLWAT